MMRTRTLGADGPDASVIGFGAWAVGGWRWGGTDEKRSIAAVRAALDAGITLIDTAAVYGFGRSEEIIGKAITGRSRDSIQIATKCGLRWDIETPELHVETEGRKIFRNLDAASMRTELERSLERLATDYIDLYQTHWPSAAADPAEVADTFARFKRDGLIRAAGFCNSSPDALQAACDSAGLDVDQERYSLLDREQETANLPLCRTLDLAFLAYSPMAQGLLTGQVDRDRVFPDGDHRKDNPRFTAPVREALAVVLAPIKSLARERQMSVEQIVLAWTLQRPGVTHALVGIRTADQARSNAEAGRVSLSADELSMLDQAASAWPGFDALGAA